MKRAFKLLVQQGDSVVAANAIARALNVRQTLLSPTSIDDFVGIAVGGDLRAKAIAIAGLDVIGDGARRLLARLSDSEAESYICWLSEFALHQSAQGRIFNIDHSNTLLSDLRSIETNNHKILP